MDDFNIYLIVSPEECKIDGSKLNISKKLPYQLNLKNYDVALTEFTTANFKAKYTIAVSKLLVNGITFSNLAGYFTTRVDLFGDAPQQIADQLHLLFGAYYAYIYENLYHNLENITKIPNEKTEVYFISNKNTKQIAVYSKLPEKDASIAYYDKNIAATKKAGLIASNTLRNDKIVIKEYETHFDKDFILRKFEDYTPNELVELYQHYSDNLPAEFTPKKTEDEKRKFLEIELKKFEKSSAIKIKTFINPPPKIQLVTEMGERPFIFDEEMYCDRPKMNHILIEADIVPLQFVNNQMKNVLKIINYGEIIPYESKDYYYKVTKAFTNTINITITSYSNLILPETILLEDNLYFNLHFKVRK